MQPKQFTAFRNSVVHAVEKYLKSASRSHGWLGITSKYTGARLTVVSEALIAISNRHGARLDAADQLWKILKSNTRGCRISGVSFLGLAPRTRRVDKTGEELRIKLERKIGL